MAYRKRAARRVVRRRRVRRLRRTIPRGIKAFGNYKMNTYTQNIVSSITTTASTDLTIAHKIKFSDLPNYADFQKLFQQYKINWYKVTWVPSHTQYDPNNGTTFNNVPFYTAVDYDQDATPTVSQILQFGNTKFRQFNKKWSQFVSPMTTLTGSSSNEIKKKSKYVWLDTTNADQYHNGLDMAVPFQAWSSSNMFVGYIITRVCFSVKYLDGTNN